jgi:hypothetical protein
MFSPREKRDFHQKTRTIEKSVKNTHKKVKKHLRGK